MAERVTSTERDLPAGDFSRWLAGMVSALRGESGLEVPCGGCTACCTASQFIHIGPDETDTLAHIPKALLFPAPRLPPGHVLMGYDERGHCPMLIDNQCSIYEHRPRTCRTYDCRVFAAADLALEEPDKELIAGQARRWQFAVSTDDDVARQTAVTAAARYLNEHRQTLPEALVPSTTTQLAVLAVEVHETFLHYDPTKADSVRVELVGRLKSDQENT